MRMLYAGCYHISSVFAFTCGRAKTIRIRYVWTRIFSKTGKKTSVFKNIIFKQHEKPQNDHAVQAAYFDTTGSMSLQHNSALSMHTICFSKPVSELVLQTGLTRPRSWTEEVSDLGRGLFSFASQHK